MDRAAVRALGLLIWLVVGIVVAYKTRKSDCGLKIICAILLTKGFVVFWIFYGVYLIVKKFIEGLKGGKDDNMRTLLILSILTCLISCAVPTAKKNTPLYLKYQHLYTANAKGVKPNLVAANLTPGNFVLGTVIELDTPEEKIVFDRGHTYNEFVHGWCGLLVFVPKSETDNTLVTKKIYAFFVENQPQNFNIDIGDRIIIAIGWQVPDRVHKSDYVCGFIRNLNNDWRNYKLPLTE